MDDFRMLLEKIESLEKRVTHLENILNGSVKGKAGRKKKLNIEQQNEIIQMHNQGVSYAALAKEYQVSKGTICAICKNKTDSIIVPVYHKRSDVLKLK